MSVVAYKNGVMCSDSRAYGGKYMPPAGVKRKAHELPDGSILGIVSADLGEPEKFLAWYKAGAAVDDWKGDPPKIRAIRVDGFCQLWLYDESLHPSGPIDTNCYAIGSGGEFALGAMLAGLDPFEAVRIACLLDGNCGEPVHTLRIPT